MIGSLPTFWLDVPVFPELRPELAGWPLRPAGMLLALLVGVLAAIDLRSRLLPNVFTLPALAVAAVAPPLLYLTPGPAYTAAGIMIALLALMTMLGGLGAGDLKLFACFAFLYGGGFIMFLLAASVVTLGYSFAIVRGERRRAEAAGTPGDLRRTKIPFGPGIAVAYPVTLHIYGVSATDAAVAGFLVLLAFALTLRARPGGAELAAIERARLEAAKEQARESAEAQGTEMKDAPRGGTSTPVAAEAAVVVDGDTAGTAVSRVDTDDER